MHFTTEQLREMERANQKRLRERFSRVSEADDALSFGLDRMLDRVTSGVESTMAGEAPEQFDECCGPMPHN